MVGFSRFLIFGWMAALSALSGGASSPGFQQVYEAGARDAAGRFMGGTELFTLASHGGKLWASVGYYWDAPGNDPATGAQILVLDKPGGRWRVDQQYDAKQWRASLDSVTFTTDGQGKKLPKPVSVLLSSPTDPQGKVVLYGRDDRTGQWVGMPLAASPQIVSVRGVVVHRDSVTGVDRVLAAASPNGIFSGVHDPAAPGGIRWEKEPEMPELGRSMGFAECNGVLYMVVKPSLYRRIDGEKPRWEKVYTIQDPLPKSSVGLRGLAAIPNPGGRGEVLLAALDGFPARILRIDPARLDKPPYQPEIELDVLDFLGQQWGRRPSFAIPAYNGMTAVTDPKTKETVLVMGLAANFAPPGDDYPKDGWEPGGWYLIRFPGHPKARYELRQIVDPARSPMPSLVATRQALVSPFGDRTLYFAGYDPNMNPSHNTAWVFAAPIATVLGPRVLPARKASQ